MLGTPLNSVGPRRQGPFVAINCAALVESMIPAELFGIEERTATAVHMIMQQRGADQYAGQPCLDEVPTVGIWSTNFVPSGSTGVTMGGRVPFCGHQ